MACCGSPNVVECGNNLRLCTSCMTSFASEKEELKAPLACCDNPYVVPDYKEGQQVCKNCGYVTEYNYLDHYVFDEDGTKTQHEYGHVGDSRQVIKGMSASKWNFRPHTCKDKVILKTMQILYENQLPSSILHDVTELFDNIHQTPGMFRGKEMESVCAAMIFITQKDTEKRKTIHQCAALVGTTQKKLFRIIKFIDSKLDKDNQSHTKSVDIAALAIPYMSLLGMRKSNKDIVTRLLRENKNLPMALNTKVAVAIMQVIIATENCTIQDKQEELTLLCESLQLRKQTVLKQFQCSLAPLTHPQTPLGQEQTSLLQD